jgi:hypothetical protein
VKTPPESEYREIVYIIEKELEKEKREADFIRKNSRTN